MRPFPQILATQAQAYGLEVHNYYAPAFYAEVFIPERVAGCMIRGISSDVERFLLLFDPAKVDVNALADLTATMTVHQLGMQRRNNFMAVCFPDWQVDVEEYA